MCTRGLYKCNFKICRVHSELYLAVLLWCIIFLCLAYLSLAAALALIFVGAGEGLALWTASFSCLTASTSFDAVLVAAVILWIFDVSVDCAKFLLLTRSRLPSLDGGIISLVGVSVVDACTDTALDWEFF